MFDNFKKFFTKQKSGLSGGSLASVRGWHNLHDYAKGLDFENSYPHISRIANEFMSIRPYGIDANGKKIKKSRVLDKIYHPNQEMSSADFREALAVMLLVHKKVLLLVWREEDGRALPGGKITAENIAGFTFLEGVTESIVGGEKRYRVGANEYSSQEVIELKGGVNPYNLNDGYSPAQASRKWANLDDYIASYQAGFFENGAVPAGEFVITAATAKEFNDIVDTLQAKHRGSGRNNNIVYTHAPIDPTTGRPMQSQIQWIPYAVPNSQLGLNEIFAQANKKIDSSFGVPASVRGVNENNTYASVRIDEQIFLKYTVRPFALRVWTRFTHELNRITGGIGFAITFDIEEVGVADEEKARAERKAVELSIIEKGVNLGYSLNSIVDAFELSNGYKLLEIAGATAQIDNDKPDVDDSGEVEQAPASDTTKHICQKGYRCEHCLKAEIKTKNSKNQSRSQIELESVFREMTELQIEKALKNLDSSKDVNEDFSDYELADNELDKFKEKIKLILWSLVLAEGVKAWDNLLGVLAVNDIDAEKATQFKIGKKLMSDYGKQIDAFSRNYSEETAALISRRVNYAIDNDFDKEQLAREIRKVAEISEWRVQRIARTEAQRAAGLAGVEAGVQIQNETGVRIYKEWVVGGTDPCGYCLAMNGRRVNVAESYVKKGGILICKAKIRVNDYADIDTAGAHPNCNCTERFGVEEDEVDTIFDYSSLDRNHPDYMYPHEQDFYERAVKEFGEVERIAKGDNSATNDFLINGSEWELKSILSDKLNRFTVRNELFRATDKGKRNIFIDNYNEKHDLEKIIEAAKKHISIEKNNKAIDSLIIVSGSKFIKIK